MTAIAPDDPDSHLLNQAAPPVVNRDSELETLLAELCAPPSLRARRRAGMVASAAAAMALGGGAAAAYREWDWRTEYAQGATRVAVTETEGRACHRAFFVSPRGDRDHLVDSGDEEQIPEVRVARQILRDLDFSALDVAAEMKRLGPHPDGTSETTLREAAYAQAVFREVRHRLRVAGYDPDTVDLGVFGSTYPPDAAFDRVCDPNGAFE